jgi:hypothetical protein
VNSIDVAAVSTYDERITTKNAPGLQIEAPALKREVSVHLGDYTSRISMSLHL